MYYCFNNTRSRGIFMPIDSDGNQYSELFFSLAQIGPKKIDLKSHSQIIRDQVENSIANGTLERFETLEEALAFVKSQREVSRLKKYPSSAIQFVKRLLGLTIGQMQEVFPTIPIANLLVKSSGQVYLLSSILLELEPIGRNRVTAMRYLNKFHKQCQTQLGTSKDILGLDNIASASIQEKESKEFGLGEDILEMLV